MLSTGPNIWDQISFFGTEPEFSVASENDMWKGNVEIKVSLNKVLFLIF